MAEKKVKDMQEENVEQEVTVETAQDKIEEEQQAEVAGEEEETSEETTKKSKKRSKKDKMSDRVAELEETLAKRDDQHLRLQAEFDNYRKRTLREKMELTKSAGESILINILPVMDDFERALDAMSAVAEKDAVKEGIELIHKRFSDFLAQNGIKEIDAKEQDFDTDLHEALTKIPAPTEELKGKNVDVIQKGYLLYDKVIRYAKVVVGE